MLSEAIKTNWYVITGAPSSGKTTVLDEMRKKGYTISPETAREYIEGQLEQGVDLETIKSDPLALQENILFAKVETEDNLDTQKIVLFDRGIPDSIAYYELSDIDIADAVKASKRHIYKAVFHFEPLPLIHDGVRLENEEEMAFLNTHLLKAYEDLGYDVIRVPAISIDERISFIEDHIKN